MAVCHEHNSRAAPPAPHPWGIRVRLHSGDPFRKLVGPAWDKSHWFATERERDAVFSDMSSLHLYSRVGDEPALVLEKIVRPAGESIA